MKSNLFVKIRRSDRKSVGLTIRAHGEKSQLTVRAPEWMSLDEIKSYIAEKKDWIQEAIRKIKKKEEGKVKIPISSIAELKRKAKEQFPIRVEEVASIYNFTYGTIKVNSAKGRWGSCNSKKNLNFSWRMAALPQHLQDYVIVHELAHTRELNHSKKFWQVVENVMPDYKSRRRELKKIQLVE